MLKQFQAALFVALFTLAALIPGNAQLMLRGVGQGGAGQSPLSATSCNASATGGVDATPTVTIASVPICAASSDRYVLIALQLRSRDPATWGAVTIGGISATQVAAQINARNMVALYIAAVPTGTTATVVATATSGTEIEAAWVNAWALTNLISTTPSSTAQTTTHNGALAVTIATSGYAFGAAGVLANTSFTWTNGTERFDTGSTSPKSRTLSGADNSTPGSVSLSANAVSATTYAAVAATLR